jgi:HD-GYP domain-containing protein (c-di-GMP phosphodiesterase class II)
MTSSRPYRRGMPPRQALKEIQKNAGAQFSKRIVEAFESLFDRIMAESSPALPAKKAIT